jgi:hypothetical protein
MERSPLPQQTKPRCAAPLKRPGSNSQTARGRVFGYLRKLLVTPQGRGEHISGNRAKSDDDPGVGAADEVTAVTMGLHASNRLHLEPPLR